jgi:hypothetical protein
MLWGIDSHVVERFGAAGIPADRVSCEKDTFVFNTPTPPSAYVADFRDYYGPTMNAFAAADQNGKAAQLQHELEALFERENTTGRPDKTRIPVTFLRVTVQV